MKPRNILSLYFPFCWTGFLKFQSKSMKAGKLLENMSYLLLFMSHKAFALRLDISNSEMLIQIKYLPGM